MWYGSLDTEGRLNDECLASVGTRRCLWAEILVVYQFSLKSIKLMSLILPILGFLSSLNTKAKCPSNPSLLLRRQLFSPPPVEEKPHATMLARTSLISKTPASVFALLLPKLTRHRSDGRIVCQGLLCSTKLLQMLCPGCVIAGVGIFDDYYARQRAITMLGIVYCTRKGPMSTQF